MATRIGLQGMFVLGLQLFFCGFFCDTLQAAKTVDFVKEIQKHMAVAERKMPDEPEEAAKDIAFALRKIEELREIDPKNPNIAVFQKKIAQLTANLRKWLREAAKEDGRRIKPVLAADAAER